MFLRGHLPALALGLLATGAIALARLAPVGDGPVLVPLGTAGLARLLADPTLADIALIDLPAPGFALLRGDNARILAAFGLAIAWKGRFACTPSP